MTRRSRRPRRERRRRDHRVRAHRDRQDRREDRPSLEAVDHASWRDVYRALDVAVSIEPVEDDPAEGGE